MYDELTEKQESSILAATGRLNLWEGAIRSGKTIGSIIRWLENLQDMPRNAGYHFAIGKTERTLRRNVVSVVQELVGPRNVRNLSESKGGGVSICGIPVLLAGANDLRAEEKIRGLTGASCYGDEVTLWPQSVFQTAIGRLSVPGATFLGTTNPDGPYHWLKTDYIDRADELGLKLFHFDIDDNPFLDRAYVEAIKREYVGLWHRRFIQGQWCAAEGAVYADAWDEARCLVREYVEQDPAQWIAACDYGTQNPCTFGLGGQAGNTLTLWDEWWWDGRKEQRQMTDGEYADAYLRWISQAFDRIREECSSRNMPVPALPDPMGVPFYVDPSASSFIAELSNRGLDVRKATNDVLEGIRTTARRLKAGTLRIHARCTHTCREFSAYSWDPKSQKLGEDKPLKSDDHAMDRTRYLVMASEATSALEAFLSGRIHV